MRVAFGNYNALTHRVFMKFNYFASLLWIKLAYGKRVDLRKKVCIEKNYSSIMLGKNAKLVIGNNFVSRSGLTIRISDGLLKIGNGCFFNQFCSFNVMKEIKIGDNCILGEDVKFYDHNHITYDNNVPFKQQGFCKEVITIGNNVWIGSNVIILKGVTVGNNCVIGAGCVVFRDIDDNTILLSNGKQLKRGDKLNE